MVAAILQEIRLRKNYLPTQTIDTIYFGGGTPSLLSADEINALINQIADFFTIKKNAEITLEANPDDLTPTNIKAFRQTPINRFSIGIQSFIDTDLQLMNRAHNAQEAHQCVKIAQDAGFHNLTIDLIYGTPTMSNEAWQANLNTTFELNIPHISAYCLTVEPKTALYYQVKKGKIADVNDEQAAQQFEILVAETTQNGYEHYEISNFCQKGYAARHNSSYWQGKPYLGVGPSAHSFDGQNRQWNVANNAQYIKAINAHTIPAEIEYLSPADRFNEYLMTSLRTNWGCDLNYIEQQFDYTFKEYLQKNITIYCEQQLMKHEGHQLFLTTKGKFVADGIISDLFFV